MQAGRRMPGGDTLKQARERCRRELALLPEPLRALEPAPLYPVKVSEGLVRLAQEVDRRQAQAPG
jgi:nicotinate phosphoribosyltransferase